MDRGAWWTTVQGVTKSQTRLNDLHNNNTNQMTNIRHLEAQSTCQLLPSPVLPVRSLQQLEKSGYPEQNPLPSQSLLPSLRLRPGALAGWDLSQVLSVLEKTWEPRPRGWRVSGSLSPSSCGISARGTNNSCHLYQTHCHFILPPAPRGGRGT